MTVTQTATSQRYRQRLPDRILLPDCLTSHPSSDSKDTGQFRESFHASVPSSLLGRLGNQVYAGLCTHRHKTYKTFLNTHTHIRMYVCTHTHLHAHTHTHTHARMHSRTHTLFSPFVAPQFLNDYSAATFSSGQGQPHSTIGVLNKCSVNVDGAELNSL